MNDAYERLQVQQVIDNKKQTVRLIKWSIPAILLIIGIAVTCMIGCPQYKVYKQRKEGEAKLAEAEFSKQVAVTEAMAKLDAAPKLAAADTLRAHGIARSQEIIGSKLTPAYIQWFFIDNLEKNQNAVFYIPTEASIPIMEAGRLNHTK